MKTTFLLLAFVIFPLTLNPWAIVRGQAAEAIFLFPRAVVLTITWLVGIYLFLNTPLKFRFKLTKFWQFCSLAVFVILLFISGLVSEFNVTIVNLLGSQTRLDGVLIQLLWYSFVPLTAYVVYWQRLSAQQVMPYLALGSSLVALWLLAQTFGFEPIDVLFAPARLLSPTPRTATLPPGPLGNSGFTGGYLAFTGGIIFLWASTVKHWGWFVVSAIIYAGLVASGNRAGLMALSGVWLLVLLVLLWRHHAAFRRALGLTLLLLGAGTVIWFTHPIPTLLAGEQMSQAVTGQDDDTSVRFVLWSLAAKILRDHVWLGVGVNGYSEALWTYASPDEAWQIVRNKLPKDAYNVALTGTRVVLYNLPNSNEQYATRIYADKAHNYLLDIGLAAGVPALIAFVVSFVASLWALVSRASSATLAVAIGLLVYGVWAMAWFAALQVDPVVCMMLGAGLGWTQASQSHDKNKG